MDKSTSIQLEALPGTTVAYRGKQYLVIDYLAHEQALILRAHDDSASIQVNQFGNATRRVRSTLSLAVCSAGEQTLLPEVAEWISRSR